MPTHKASIDSRESIRHSPPTKSPVNRLSAAPTRDFMDGVPWRKRVVVNRVQSLHGEAYDEIHPNDPADA